MTIIEIVAFITGILGVYLTSKQHILCWPVSIFNVLLYAIIFYDVKLYADAVLQLYFMVLCMYGWWAWRKKNKGETLKVTSLSKHTPLKIIAIMSIGSGLSFSLLHYYTDASFPFLDSICFVGSIIAQWLQARKKIESWLIWIAVDAIYVVLYLYKDLYLTAMLYTIFIALALYGYQSWKRSLKSQL